MIEGLIFKRGLGANIYIRAVRHKATQELVKAGIDEKDAEKAILKAMKDDEILEYSSRPEIGALGDGKILGALGNLIQWIIDHEEQIKRVVAFLLSLAPLFL